MRRVLTGSGELVEGRKGGVGDAKSFWVVTEAVYVV